MKRVFKAASLLSLLLPAAITFAGRPARAMGDLLSQGKNCYQSSAWEGNSHAEYAVNGKKTGRFAFHTNADNPSWWYVDLGQSQAIGLVRVYNRMDCCGDRAKSFQIFLSNDARNWGSAVYSNNGADFGGVDPNNASAEAGGGPREVDLKGAKGRYLKIQLKDRQPLHLDQVEVYAYASTATIMQGVGGSGGGAPSMPGMPF